MKICQIDFELESWKSDFPDYEIKLFRSSSFDYINCFVCYISDENKLHNDWDKVVGLIAGEFQAKLDSDLEVWNIYLIFCTKSEVNTTLIYEIENNKFAMRKLVTCIGNWNINYNIEDYINEEIFCTDLELTNKSEDFVSTDTFFISKLHENIMLMSESENMEKLNYELYLKQIDSLIELVAKNEI